MTTRKDWMTTTKSVVTIGESMAARIDGTRGRRASTPVCILCEGKPTKPATSKPNRKYPQECPRGGEDEHPSRTDLTETDPGYEEAV